MFWAQNFREMKQALNNWLGFRTKRTTWWDHYMTRENRNTNNKMWRRNGCKYTHHTLLEAMTGLTKLTMKKEGSSCTLGLWWVQNKFWLNHRNCFLHHEILKSLFGLNLIKKFIYPFFQLCFWSVLRQFRYRFLM